MGQDSLPGPGHPKPSCIKIIYKSITPQSSRIKLSVRFNRSINVLTAILVKITFAEPGRKSPPDDYK
jgi:hypothetical protein